MDKLKGWLVEVAIKKMGPSAIRAILAAGLGFIAAHAGWLEGLGVVYDKATNDLVIHLTKTTEWLVALGLGTATAFLRAGQYHAVEAKKTENQQA